MKILDHLSSRVSDGGIAGGVTRISQHWWCGASVFNWSEGQLREVTLEVLESREMLAFEESSQIVEILKGFEREEDLLVAVAMLEFLASPLPESEVCSQFPGALAGAAVASFRNFHRQNSCSEALH